MKTVFSVVMLVAVLSGCASQPSSTTHEATNPALKGACVANFATEGGFWSGQRHSTHEVFQKKPPAAAFDSVLQTMATSGYQIVTSSKESGLISANQTVSYGKGKTVPINVVIKKLSASETRVDVSLSLSGGVSAPIESVQGEFCKFLEAVRQTPNVSEPAAQQSTPPSGEMAGSKKNTATSKKSKKKTTGQ